MSTAAVEAVTPSVAADVMVREYKEGVLVREDAISVEQLNSIFRPVKAAYKKNRSIRKQRTKVHTALSFGSLVNLVPHLCRGAAREAPSRTAVHDVCSGAFLI